MLQKLSKLVCADNSGVKLMKVIGILGKDRFAYPGSVVAVTVKEVAEGSEINPGTVLRALVIRCRRPIKRVDGRFIRFGDNAAVMLSKENKLLGTRIEGPVPRELRKTIYVKAMAMAKTII